MEDVLMIFAVIIFFIIGSILIKSMSEEKKEIWIDKKILIIHDKPIDDDILQYANSTTTIDKEIIYRYSFVIIYTEDDYNNLMFIYHVKKQNEKCKIFTICNNKEMKSLYLKEQIELFDSNDLNILVKHLYEQTNK